MHFTNASVHAFDVALYLSHTLVGISCSGAGFVRSSANLVGCDLHLVVA